MELISQKIIAQHQNKREVKHSEVGETGNEAVTVMWRKHFAELLNASKTCEISNFLKQNLISHGNFEGIDELMCNSFKIKYLLRKLPMDRAADKDGIQ